MLNEFNIYIYIYSNYTLYVVSCFRFIIYIYNNQLLKFYYFNHSPSSLYYTPSPLYYLTDPYLPFLLLQNYHFLKFCFDIWFILSALLSSAWVIAVFITNYIDTHTLIFSICQSRLLLINNK